MADNDTTAPGPAATPAPEPRKLKTDSTVEEAVEVVADQIVRSKSPLITILVTLLTGGGVAFGGWQTSTALTKQVEVLTAKVDKLTDELVDMRKEIAAGVTRAQAERHEERIRALETKDHEQERALDKVLLEIEALKKASNK